MGKSSTRCVLFRQVWRNREFCEVIMGVVKIRGTWGKIVRPMVLLGVEKQRKEFCKDASKLDLSCMVEFFCDVRV